MSSPSIYDDVKKYRGTRDCQHCYRQAASGVKLMLCAGCKRTYYCNRECQRADWKRHKGLCQHEQLMTTINYIDPPKEKLRRLGMTVTGFEELAHKWVEIHTTAFTYAAAVAVDICHSDRYKTEMLFVEIEPRADWPKQKPRTTAEIAKAFRLDSIEVYKISDLLVKHPAMKEAINAVHMQTNSDPLMRDTKVVTVAFSCSLLNAGPMVGKPFNAEAIELFEGLKDPGWKDTTAAMIRGDI